MNRKFTGVLFPLFNTLLVLTLLSGCTAAGTASETATPPAGETNASQSESSTPDPTVDNTVSEIGTPPARETTPASTAENSTPEPTAESEGYMAEPGTQQEVIDLWEEGNMPTTTVYTQDPNAQYFDPPDFRPNMVYYPAAEGVAVKGAVLLAAGGAFRFRSDADGAPVAEGFNQLGYHAFVVNYRLRPYTMQEGALDLGRAVRYVRSHAEEYGIDEQDIAGIGFSAGGILWGELLLNFDGTVNGTSIDPNYVPDELDQVSADASAVGMIYSFYGRLSVASTDVEKFKASDLPPAFFAYGTEDPFVREFEENIAALRQAGIPVEDHVLQGWPHGFGAGDGQWIRDFDHWVTKIFENNS